MSKAYFLRGDSYLRFDLAADAVDAGYPKPAVNGWSGLGGTGFESGVDSAIDLGNGKLYLFKGASYLRIDQSDNSVDSQPASIADNWGGFAQAGFGESISAAVNWGNGKAYFFRGDQYIRYDIATDAVDDGASKPIGENWPGFAAAGFGDALDAAFITEQRKAFFFRGDSYVRYDIATDQVEEGYPKPITGNWPGMAEAGFTGAVDAAWMKLVGKLGPGDHVWYFNGQLSADKNIPRTTWFPGSTNETDYRGHGEEIFNFVVHEGGQVFRGQPHMKNKPGTHAWLNNNPGNITGLPGGPDYGQYKDKFNWHNFLIFPTREAGFQAIATFLRTASCPQRGPYRDLSLTDAFECYAPASDGNDPAGYAQSVATAAGVPVGTFVRDLNDTQMRHLQDKIAAIEGAVAGDVLTADSTELPAEIKSRLG